MVENLVDIIANHISESYTFINSDGEQYTDDGYTKARNFIENVLLPQVDEYIEDNYTTGGGNE